MPPAQSVEKTTPAGASGKRERAAPSTPAGAERHTKRKCDLDLDILECPICSEPFTPPVYQCQNGHTACSACCKSLVSACPSCAEPIGHIRCITAEKIVESLLVSCRYIYSGCKITLRCTEREEHEEDCNCKPFRCPFPGCMQNRSVVTLPMHLTEKHNMPALEVNSVSKIVGFGLKPSEEHVMLKTIDQEFFLFHREVKELLGEIFFCTSFGESNKSYKLKVTLSHDSTNSYAMAGDEFTDVQKREICRKSIFLLVPFAVNTQPMTREFDVKLTIF